MIKCYPRGPVATSLSSGVAEFDSFVSAASEAAGTFALAKVLRHQVLSHSAWMPRQEQTHVLVSKKLGTIVCDSIRRSGVTQRWLLCEKSEHLRRRTSAQLLSCSLEANPKKVCFHSESVQVYVGHRQWIAGRVGENRWTQRLEENDSPASTLRPRGRCLTGWIWALFFSM